MSNGESTSTNRITVGISVMKTLWPWAFSTMLICALSTENVSGNSCQVHPSEYAYHNDYVMRSENSSANCRRYSCGLSSTTASENYIHCDGTPLRLTDSDTGSQMYRSSDYYEWPAGSEPRKLLFIFPTTVGLTSMTLTYYSDSQRGRPPLRFTAVPDDFNVWDEVLPSYSYIDIAGTPHGSESVGRTRNIVVNLVTIDTTRLLMVKEASSLKFALSEVLFYAITCIDEASTPAPSDGLTTAKYYQPTAMADTCTCSESVSTREVVSWVLVGILSVLFTGLLTVLVLQWLVKKRQLNRDTHNKTSKYEMEGNPCYGVSMSQDMAQDYEAVT